MKFILLDTVSNEELVLPVTPSGFQASFGTRIETINIHTLGDVALAGCSTLSSPKISCMFPAKDYPFNQPGTVTDPYYYIRKLEAWRDAKTLLRWIVSGTTVNVPVKLEDVAYGEQDGSGDVYATISLREFRQLAAVNARSSETGNNARPAENSSPVTANAYPVRSGDTLSAIARKFYGNAALYPQLAKYNGIKNANLIYVGQVIKIPDKSLL